MKDKTCSTPEDLEEDTLDTVEPHNRGLEGYGSSSATPPTPQRPFSMEHGQQEVQPGILLGRTLCKLSEDISQRDRLQRPYGNHQRLESHQEVHTAGGEGKQDKGESEQLTQTGNTQIPSGSQGVGQTNYPVASHHSRTSR
ncbi:hypothetical protein O181_086988 [Austropuccinia psidii MF-1]|uniref:Uncharacterized protein n=1 Tax=Austropuccinia psidii MF-1 TaxID=1389203 RepID=A0A9Q3INV5_9BASI|nr:hypothetical protein [Austropuccinia psidii MF-1]